MSRVPRPSPMVVAGLEERRRRDIASLADRLHAAHHEGPLVPSLDSCSVHARRPYEDAVAADYTPR